MTTDGLDWIITVLKINRQGRTPRLLHLLWVEGHTIRAAAAEVGLRPVRAQAIEGRTLRRIARRRGEAPPDERRLWDLYLMPEAETPAPEPTETEYAHARHLLQAQANRQQPSDRSPVMDENGRRVGGRGPLVSVEQAVRLFREPGVKIP